MKKFLLTLAAAALCASAAFADATVVIKDQTPYTGGATTDAVEWTNGHFTFNPAKGDPKATVPATCVSTPRTPSPSPRPVRK